jgi:photosystem II stability/assembly factor-like uncharacterized protein
MRKRFWPGPFVTALLFAFSSMALAQSIGPGRGQPPYPVRSGVAPSPKQGGEEARSSAGGAVASMKLLAPNVGWAMSMRRLLWTSNGGTEWEDITPPASKGAVISGVFFLDTGRGWVTLEHGEPDVPGGLQFDLASTDNAGATWSVEPLRIPDQLSGSLTGGGASVAFADPNRGWLILYSGSTPISRGRGSVLTTADGGKSWEDTPGTPDSAAGPVLMVTPQFGWMVGGGGNEELYVTRDGAKTWQTVELEPPEETEQMQQYKARLQSFERSFHPSGRGTPRYSSGASYDLPTFKDLKHGYVSVTYPGVTVLFATDDGGVTWRPDRVLEGRPAGPSALVDSTWIVARVPRNGMPELRKLGPGASARDSTPPAPEVSGIFKMSFAASSQGWVVTNYFKLLSTNDGGATWTDITPGRKLQATTP